MRTIIQKIIVFIYGLSVATACIYVPCMYWEASSDRGRGYKLLWYLNYAVDIERVILEIIAITAVFAVLFVLTLKPKKRE